VKLGSVNAMIVGVMPEGFGFPVNERILDAAAPGRIAARASIGTRSLGFRPPRARCVHG